MATVTTDGELWWVQVGDGAARRITPGGLLVGRFPRCDIVIRSPQSSRRQALLYLGDEGPRVAVMGRAPVEVNGAAVEGDVELDDGSTIVIEELSLRVSREEVSEGAAEQTSAVWVLEDGQGGMFSFSQPTFRVGGSDGDDLRIERLPDGALEFRARDSLLEVRAAGALEVDGEAVEEGEARRLRRGSKLAFGEVELRVVTGGELGTGSTMSLETEREARSARLEFMPRGGRLHIRVGDEERSVYLTDRRCDFIAVLLQPPPPLAAGDYVPDEHLWARVWGKQPAGKKTLHVLLHRLRKDLDRVGLDGSALLERSEGGGATRFALAPDAEVALE